MNPSASGLRSLSSNGSDKRGAATAVVANLTGITSPGLYAATLDGLRAAGLNVHAAGVELVERLRTGLPGLSHRAHFQFAVQCVMAGNRGPERTVLRTFRWYVSI